MDYRLFGHLDSNVVSSWHDIDCVVSHLCKLISAQGESLYKFFSSFILVSVKLLYSRRVQKNVTERN